MSDVEINGVRNIIIANGVEPPLLEIMIEARKISFCWRPLIFPREAGVWAEGHLEQQDACVEERCNDFAACIGIRS